MVFWGCFVDILIAAFFVFGGYILAGVFAYLWLKSKKQADACNVNLASYQDRFSEVFDKERELAKLKHYIEKLRAQAKNLKVNYSEKLGIYKKLREKIAIYDEQLEMAELGMYEPHFDFDTSEKYKDRIKSVRAEQKSMLKDKTAIYCTTEWTVEGSKSKGKTMTNRGIRLTARAFNNECDAAISNVTWKNVETMEKRIDKAFDAINKMNESNKIIISNHYLRLKLDELHLAYEYQEKRQQEREELAEARRQEREEERLRKEAEKAKKEESKLQALLASVQAKADAASGDELERLRAEVEKLGGELKDMQRNNDRVKAMAEQTKLGYVYIISNIGSFGENIYKIGMTRRLEPMDRVRELGDASVPFYFDVHAMIFSQDAPALEAAIQRQFAEKRVNLVNNRKEFFNVDLNDVKEVVWKHSSDIEFVDDVEAKEYKETLYLRRQEGKKIDDEFPDMV